MRSDRIPRRRFDANRFKEISQRSLLVNHSIALGGRSRPAPCWALTQVDVLLCALPIAVFLSIVSLV